MKTIAAIQREGGERLTANLLGGLNNQTFKNYLREEGGGAKTPFFFYHYTVYIL